MKKDTKIKLGAALMGVVITTALVAGISSAYEGDFTQKGSMADPERHEAMTVAFENNDYKAWKELMAGRGRVTEKITADNFEKFANVHALVEDGKIDEARALRAEIGLGTGNDHDGQGRKMGRNNGFRKMHKMVDNNGDGICDYLDQKTIE